MVEDLRHGGLGDQSAGRVSRRAEVDELDGRVRREGGKDGGHVRVEGGSLEGDRVDGDVVDGGGDGVHAVGWGAGQDLGGSGGTEAAEEGVDGFVGADADEEVRGSQGFGGVGVGVAEVAEVLF